MFYKIEKHCGESAYLQLYRQLRSDIVSGALPCGSKLPSKRVLAAELGISVITAEHAFALLIDEGYAESRPRSGVYVSFGGKKLSSAAGHRAALEDMQASSSADRDFPFSVLARTMRTVLTEYDRRLLIRSPNSGCAELRQAVALWLERSRGLSVGPEQIVIGSGAEYLYGLVVQLLGRDTFFALEDPSYEKIQKVYEANGAKCLFLPMGEDGILSSELEECRAGVLHVTPFHSYPSGVTASAAKRHEYAHWAEKNGAYLLEDDYDSEFASPTRQVETIASLAPDRVIYINTFSKVLAPSFRTGFMVLPGPLTEKYRETLGFYSCTVPVFDQLVLARFISEGHLERYINRRKRKARQKNG